MTTLSVLNRLKGMFKDKPADGPAGDGSASEAWSDLRLRGSRGLRVLVVDDSPTVAAVLGRMLSDDGYEVATLNNGEEALVAAKDIPDLIVLDIVMPGMSGFAVLRALRRDPATSAIPVIMISGNLKATEQFYGERIGADDFIRKPFGRAEVMASIQRLIDSGRLPSHRIDTDTGRDSESVPADNGNGPDLLLLDEPDENAATGPAADPASPGADPGAGSGADTGEVPAGRRD